MAGRTQRQLRVDMAHKKYAKYRDEESARPQPGTLDDASRVLLREVESYGGASAVGMLGRLESHELLDERFGLVLWIRNRLLWRNPVLVPPGTTEDEVRAAANTIGELIGTAARRDYPRDVTQASWAVDRLRFGGRPLNPRAREGPRRDLGLLPLTVPDAIIWLLREIPRPQLAQLGALEEAELIHTHFGLALGIRNELLWTNPTLVRATGKSEPDGASEVLVRELWVAVRADPSMSQEIASHRAKRTEQQSRPARSTEVPPAPRTAPPRPPSPAPISQASDVAEAIVYAALYGMRLSPQLELAAGREIDERDDGERYDPLISLDQLRGYVDGEAEEHEDDDEVSRLRDAFEQAMSMEPISEYAMVQEFVDGKNRSAWVADFVGDRGAHRLEGPFLSWELADASISARGLRSEDDVTELTVRRLEQGT